MRDFRQPVGAQGPPPPPGYGAPPPPGYGAPPPPGYGAPPPPGYGPPLQERSKLPLVSGIFFLLGAIILFVNIAWMGSALGAVESSGIGDLAADEARDALNMLWAQCVVLPLIGAIFMVLGAVFAIKHTKFTMVLMGGIIGMICALIGSVIVAGGITIINPLTMLGFIFGLLGLILALAGKKGFD